MTDSPGTTPATVVTVSSGQSAHSMRSMTLAAMQGDPRDLVLDLREANVMARAELALLVGLRARQRSLGRALTLVCARDSSTEEVLSRSGMRGLFATVTALPSGAVP